MDEEQQTVPMDSSGCPSASDFRMGSGIVVLTRCSRLAGHSGRHHSRTQSWHDGQTTWLVSPPQQVAPTEDEEQE